MWELKFYSPLIMIKIKKERNVIISCVISILKDAYITENSAYTNYGADDFLRVGNYEHYGIVQEFYHFDISSLPEAEIMEYIKTNNH